MFLHVVSLVFVLVNHLSVPSALPIQHCINHRASHRARIRYTKHAVAVHLPALGYVFGRVFLCQVVDGTLKLLRVSVM